MASAIVNLANYYLRDNHKCPPCANCPNRIYVPRETEGVTVTISDAKGNKVETHVKSGERTVVRFMRK